MGACGGAYSPETRRKYFISGPQWAAAYQGQALFHAPTREPIGFEAVIREYAEIGIPYWATHDTDVIPVAAIGKEEQSCIVERIKRALENDGLRCSMVTTDTFHHAVWAAEPGGGIARGARICRVPVEEHGGDRPRTRRGVCSLLARVPGLPGAGGGGGDRDARLVRRRVERRLRARHPGGAQARPPHPQALPGGQAVRAAGRDPAAHLGRHAGLHRLGPADASRNGRSQPGIPARVDVGRSSARGARPRFDRRQAVAPRYQRRLPPQARRGYRRRAGQPVRLAERAGAAAQPRLPRAVQPGLQTAAHHQQLRRLRGELPDGRGPLHHFVGDGRRGDGGFHSQGGCGGAQGWWAGGRSARCRDGYSRQPGVADACTS